MLSISVALNIYIYMVHCVSVSPALCGAYVACLYLWGIEVELLRSGGFEWFLHVIGALGQMCP